MLTRARRRLDRPAGKARRFLRDFRGDTIHPSTLDVMAELGCSSRFCSGRIKR